MNDLTVRGDDGKVYTLEITREMIERPVSINDPAWMHIHPQYVPGLICVRTTEGWPVDFEPPHTLTIHGPFGPISCSVRDDFDRQAKERVRSTAMRHRSTKQSRLERENRDWRQALILEVGHCQVTDCPGEFPRELCVHEIPRGTHARRQAYGQRLACLVACAHCNGERLTDYSLWPIERQAALQCVLVADIAEPAEVLAVINSCRGRDPSAITWTDCAKYLTV